MHKEPPRTSKHLPYEVDPQNRGHFYENYWKHCALKLLEKHVPGKSNNTVLDYGCGRGETLDIFGCAGFKVVGADIDPHCVKLSKSFGEAHVLDPENPVAQFGAGSFDIVTCFHVLEHVENPKRTLNQLREIARNYVVLAVPNLRHLHSFGAKQIQLHIINEGHLQSWDHLYLLNLAERHCGLKLVEWGFDATILPIVSNLTWKLLGTKATVALETGIFRRLFPFHGISVIGLFKVQDRS